MAKIVPILFQRRLENKLDEYYKFMNMSDENGVLGMMPYIYHHLFQFQELKTESLSGALDEGYTVKGASWTRVLSVIGTNSDDIIDGTPYDFIDANDGDDDIIFDIDEQLSPFESISAIGGDGNDTFIINHNYPTNILTNPFSADITEQFFLDGGAGIDIVFANSGNSQTQNMKIIHLISTQ